MRKWMIGLIATYVGIAMFGCAEQEKKDKIRVQAPFVDVRVKEDGSTRVKAPGTDVKVNR